MDIAALRSAWDGIQASWSLSEKINTAWTESIAEVGTETGVRAGGKILSKDDSNVDLGFILLSGDIRIEKMDSPEIVKPGPELLGEMGQLNPTRVRTADVYAETDTSLVQFNWAQLNAALLKRLSEEEIQSLMSGIQQYAWGHFTE